MQFNLIDQKWIPVKRRDGTAEDIAPWELTSGFTENPVLSLNAPRPDFNGALIQFLIGLMQTLTPPISRTEWKQKLANPPGPGELESKFAVARHAFELGGRGPKFMQDIEDIESEPGPIHRLFIDSPGENTLKNNADLFVKRSHTASICPSCAAMALLTMQINAPSGGQGYRTSLRGGGPLTTLVLGDGKLDTLWHIVWLNLIEKAKFLDLCDGAKTSPSDQFPWLARTKPKTTAMDIHPAQLFWAMPRRIRLNFDDLSSGVCTVCSRQSDLLISRYREKNKGTEYVAPVKHPLSPYDARKGKAVLGKRGGVHYRHWLGLVISDPGVGIEPAAVVHEFIEGGRLQHDCQFRIWAFGYDMDNMKARGWHEARMPLIEAAPHVKGEYEPHVFSMVKAADQVAKNLRDAVKRAWFRRPGDVKQGVAFLDRAFWQNTEHAFYGSLHSLKTALESGGSVLSAAEEWLSSLCGGALALFDVHAWNGPIEDADPKRVVIARNDMDKFNRGKKIKEMLGLPVQKQSKARTDKRKGPAD